MDDKETSEVLRRLEALQRQVAELSHEQEATIAHRVFKSARTSIKVWIGVWIAAITLVTAVLGFEGSREFMSYVSAKALEYVKKKAIPQVDEQLKAGSLAAFSELDAEFSGIRIRAESRLEELEKRIEALGSRAAEKLGDPELKQIARSSGIRLKPPQCGYAFYGIHLKDEHWNRRYFRREGGEPKALPQRGDHIIAEGSVNVRGGYIEYTPLKSWKNKPVIGAIHEGDTLVVEDTKDVAGGYIWIKFRTEPKAECD